MLVPGWASAKLDRDGFAWLAELVRDSSGIALPDVKQVLLESRLRRRLRALELPTFADYIEHLQDPAARASELPALVDAVATNQTSFFREPRQFEYLLRGAAGSLALENGVPRVLRAWCAGCSTGEEAYTLAMVLAEAGRLATLRGYTILASDISQTALHQARRAIYKETAVAALPTVWRQRYLMRSRDRSAGLVRVSPELRAAIRYERRNLIDAQDQPDSRFDLIFCRNVLIYFGADQRRCVLGRLCARLRLGGMLCLGHADNISGFRLPLRMLEVNTYERIEGAAP
jgi:chemotaxis protein methyltransferase CheR